ncbi:MAG: hypothetical protein LLG06_04860 [Desulfobacteraceae bacterium]|nr:hypothetical protein [Desulfobacteraceae bacterium]
MKRNRKEAILRVERALLDAHRSGDSAEPGGQFHSNAMRRIRQIGPHPLSSAANGTEPRFIWRFAAASCAIAVAVFLYSSSMDFSAIQLQAAQSLVEDSADFVLAEALAVI